MFDWTAGYVADIKQHGQKGPGSIKLYVQVSEVLFHASKNAKFMKTKGHPYGLT